MIHVRELWIYPLKSARGIRLDESELSPTGLRGDRRWMLVDANGRFITQRECPQMAQIEVVYDQQLQLNVQGETLTFALPPYDAPFERVQIWRSQVLAQVLPTPTVLSAFLGRSVRLVYLPDSSRRETNPEYAPGQQVSFADGYPYLISQEGSLNALNQVLKNSNEPPVSMAHFRPNIVLSATEAYAEDHWKSLMIGDHHFESVKPCERCVIITHDPFTGEAQPSVLQSLASTHRLQGKVVFGQNAYCHDASGWIRVGDSVTFSHNSHEKCCPDRRSSHSNKVE